MAIKYLNTVQDAVDYASNEFSYLVQRYNQNQQSVNAQQVGTLSGLAGALSGVDAANSVITGVTGLIKGIRTLKRTSDPAYRVEVSITNKTNYLLGIVEVDKHNANIGAAYILPSEQASVTFTEHIGQSGSDGSIIYLAVISEDKWDYLSLGISDQTTSSSSKLIQMSHLTQNFDSSADLTTYSPYLNNANEDIPFGYWEYDSDLGTFNICSSYAGTSDQSTLNISILQEIPIPPEYGGPWPDGRKVEFYSEENYGGKVVATLDSNYRHGRDGDIIFKSFKEIRSNDLEHGYYDWEFKYTHDSENDSTSSSVHNNYDFNGVGNYGSGCTLTEFNWVFYSP
ncbi:hypothetical protein [Scandinavium lactucae]|uniref:Uncharacterized protein n=1 Tax=Scandinavium lactucae TaxID=3095028 RepID=A0ABU4QS75_9ENTR|nr:MULTISPECIES: hypothetical protein [unclassified Scandinavium]MDX6040125.1 hypothetical protein [Scandinavium sp. V105_6]MDX6048666.1 hypothetical protein [Scandinavium sp. V105_1]